MIDTLSITQRIFPPMESIYFSVDSFGASEVKYALWLRQNDYRCRLVLLLLHKDNNPSLLNFDKQRADVVGNILNSRTESITLDDVEVYWMGHGHGDRLHCWRFIVEKTRKGWSSNFDDRYSLTDADVNALLNSYRG
ncbi:hypothetical protein OAS86_02265 [Gammaproteobacteria bacterium]|nr:hypothetical protein [Gammaproteobacteria bacterium]